jgi:hypothetical protein
MVFCSDTGIVRWNTGGASWLSSTDDPKAVASSTSSAPHRVTTARRSLDPTARIARRRMVPPNAAAAAVATTVMASIRPYWVVNRNPGSRTPASIRPEPTTATKHHHATRE